MHVSPLSQLVCPIDGEALVLDPRGADCPAGHHFDRAREGHLNLLLVQHKASRQPGDDAAMVRARTRVLDGGLFAPLADRVAAILLASDPVHAAIRLRKATGTVSPGPHVRIVDAGCGDGYYLDRLASAARADPADVHLEVAGFDISRYAARAAVRRMPAATFLVASTRRLPFPSATIDVLLSVFGFPHWPAFAAGQPPGGLVVLADPGPDHLIELRRQIYPDVHRRPPRALDAAGAAGYEPVAEEALRWTDRLATPDAIAALLAMTPHGHRMPAERRARIEALAHLDLTLDVVIRTLRRRG